MYDIIDAGEFKIFYASKQAQNIYKSIIKDANRSNEEFIHNNSTSSPAASISGSFICAHSPNYIGNPALTWGVDKWRELFIKFREFGMDTAIFQTAVWNELEECYYSSQVFSSFKGWNVIEPMLEAAATENIRIFLGGFGSTTGQRDVNNDVMLKEKQLSIDCLTELMNYRDLFEGFYFSSETAFTGKIDQNKTIRLNKLYRDFFEHIKTIDDSLRIMMSPGTKYFAGKEQEMADNWLAMLDGVPLDILAPQDSIGTCGSRLCNADAMYRIWSEICKSIDVTFWSNIEIFQRNDLSQMNHSITASPERVIAQINLAAPYAEKLICWEAQYYLCDPGNPHTAPLAQAIFQKK